MRSAAALLVALAVAACERPATEMPGATTGRAAPAPAAAAEWPAPGAAVDLRRERSVDLTGDGSAELITVTARGPRYDSLAIALTIMSPARDTLWHDRWSSLHYFSYDPLEGKADSTIGRIVRSHVDSLLADDRISTRDMPPRLTQGTHVEEALREAVRYHLAELDWRSGADLTPAEDTPPDAHSRIDARIVGPARVEVVLEELRQRPVFWYYAGGEETYAIAWSDREHAFVRLYSCC